MDNYENLEEELSIREMFQAGLIEGYLELCMEEGKYVKSSTRLSKFLEKCGMDGGECENYFIYKSDLKPLTDAGYFEEEINGQVVYLTPTDLLIEYCRKNFSIDLPVELSGKKYE